VISPKKTVEGALGGFGLSLLISIVFKLTVIKNFGWLGILIIPGIVVIFAQVGDLCESFLKRAFSKKDSGSILPGHGGFLDRFDAVVFGLPVMYACVRIFN
jgi:phosphatidate cytidylyltransferase